MSLTLENFPPATIPPRAEALRGEVKAFIAALLEAVPPHVRARTWAGFDAGFSRAMAERGWIGLHFTWTMTDAEIERHLAAFYDRAARQWRLPR